jgi:thymidylate synthase
MADRIYPTVTHAFLAELEAVVRTGETVVGRGGVCRELHPRLVRVAAPRRRVLLAPQRNNNLFAAVAETMWVLAGRNDIAFLARYLPRAADYSDDGLVWRGGYGPRLRNWGGVDQLQVVAHRLRQSPESRRAVIALFDPARDNTPSLDIPCNNWLHALIRQGRLDLSVAIRSNDIMWGFSGINAFEWSVLQELLAHCTSAQLGTTSYFIDSLHLYERHYARAERILAERRHQTLYDFGFTSPPFSTPLEAFDDRLGEWCALEKRLRSGEQLRPDEWGRVPDDLLGTCLRLVAIYNRFLDGAEPQSDLKTGAIEYLTRALKDRSFVPLTPRELAFFGYFWDGVQIGTAYTFEDVFDVLGVLHDKKTRAYGDSWRKHGEVASIFANISRKYDRMETALKEGTAALSDESILDTVADLAVYCTKYLTYLAEQYPAAFAEFRAACQPATPIEAYQGNSGFGAVAKLLWERQQQADNARGDAPAGGDQDVADIRGAYAALEHRLVTHPGSGSPAEKVAAAAQIASAAVRWLVKASQVEGERFPRFVAAVDAL